MNELPKEAYEQLIYDAKNGSSYALGQLLQQNYNAVYRYILKLTLDVETAHDVTQDCMTKVIEKFSLYDPEKASLSTWMIAIAKNLWIEDCRKKVRSRRYIAEFGEAESAATVLGDNDLEKDDLLSAIKRLHEKERVVVILKHINGYSYEEIAKMLKIPLGTVKSRISNGIKSLKRELTGYERE